MSAETIILVEDNDAVALGLKHAFLMEQFKFLRAANAAEARLLVREQLFDVLILDIRLPDGSGYDLCREFRSAGVRQPILMLTARDETIDKVVGLELGADDYMTKPFNLQELMARIRALLRRSRGSLSPASGRHLSIGELEVDLVSQSVRRGGQEIALTATEFRLLVYLAQQLGRPVSREKLVSGVWGYEQPVGDLRMVDVHIRNLRLKVEPFPSQPIYVVTVRGLGYMLQLPQER